jgi:hypothetical protein
VRTPVSRRVASDAVGGGCLSSRVEPRVLRLPALVRGELVWPAPLSADQLDRVTSGVDPVRHENAYVVPSSGPGGDRLFMVLPYADPVPLVEHDHLHLARCLHELPFDDVLDYVAGLSELLRVDGELVQDVLAAYEAHSGDVTARDTLLLKVLLDILPGLFDPAGVQAAVAAELDQLGRRGRDFLDGWVAVGERQVEGVNIRLADSVFAEPGAPGPAYARRQALLRAIPTRQLHITAGNAPIIPAVSLLRALTTKGAAVMKSPISSWLVSTILVLALHRLGRSHPLTHHTSIVYWKGGDRSVEDVLLQGDAFDRVAVWGGAETIASIRARTTIPTIMFEPRVGMSLVGQEAFGTDLREVVIRATADSLVENQAACTASLVHYVEADETQALRYCQALQGALARWDVGIPHQPSPLAKALLRRLRRDALVGARWFVNGRWPEVTSAVIYAPFPFDLSIHPMSRCVIVRRVDDLAAALPYLNRGVAAVGVWPLDRWVELRGVIAARGVTTVAPLGESERRWSGMPHDGMRPLSQLVNWAVG